MFKPIIILALSVAFLAGSASAFPLDGPTPGTVITKCTQKGTAALTFDDGPYQYLKQVVDTLDRHNAKGTFFLNGNNWDCIYNPAEVDRIKYAFKRGHQLGSHTWAHKHLPSIKDRAQLEKEFSSALDAIHKITGAYPAFTRCPYGEYNDLTKSVAKQYNQILVNWDYDTRDAEGVPVSYSKGIYDKAVKEHHDTVLVLNHEPYETTVNQVLPYAIVKLQDAGYRLVTVAECLGLDPYVSIGPSQPRDETWDC